MLLISNFSEKTTLLLSVALLSSFPLLGCSQVTPSASVEPDAAEQVTHPSQPALTLNNLQAAYNGESNAHVMYLAYGKKAEEEGYKGAAILFKSAARAEEIHRDNHAKVIKEMGGTPENKINTPEVKSTQENLENAIKGESYERQEMYPAFIKQAQAEGNKDAIQTFTYASDAEAQHAQLYKQALKNLDSWKAAKEFYVCPLSGNTTISAQQNSCSTADGVKNKLEKLS